MTAMFEQAPISSSIYVNCANQYYTMPNYRKRPLDDTSMDELDAPLEKKKYEQISDDLNKFSINSPVIQECEDESIDEDLPTTSNAQPDIEEAYIVEEPEESGQLVLSDDLINYLRRKQSENIIPIRKNNKELILYNPADSIRTRIIELIGDQEEPSNDEVSEQPTIDESKSPSPSPGSPVCLDEEQMMDADDQMEID